MVDDAKVKRISKKRKTHPVLRRVLFAAACLLVAVSVTVFSIPSARAAVEVWFDDWFSAEGYFRQEKEARTSEPTIEAITTSAGENNVTISNIGEEFAAYAEAFDIKLDEIAYDGADIYLSGTMSGATARPFVEAFTGGDTYRCAKNDGSLGGGDDWEYYFFECESVFELKTANGDYIGNIVPNITDDMQSIIDAAANDESAPVFQDGKLVTTSAVADALWDEYLADHDVRFSVKLLKVFTDMQPLTGMVDGELSLRLYYGNVASEEAIPVLQADFGTITIDASAYQAETQTTQAQAGTSVDLGGVHPITIQEWQPEAERTTKELAVYYYTHELDFTGASFSLKEISFTPTDTIITLHVVLPSSWTREERRGGEFGFRFLVDGKQMSEPSDSLFSVCGPDDMDYDTSDYLEFDYSFYESTLSPSQWAAMKTLTVFPISGYWWEMSLSSDNESFQAYSLKDDAVITTYSNVTSTMYNELYEEMPQYSLTINLDDYR